jgi:hypothetical protein
MKSYKPLITEPQAQKLLTIRGKILRFRKTLPQRMELLYVPYYFFTLLVRNKKGDEKNFYAAVDAIVGGFAIVERERLDEIESEKTEFQPQLSREDAYLVVEKEARWFLYRESVKMHETFELVKTVCDGIAGYPYWVGYYRDRSGAWEFHSLDAISGRLQLGNGRRLFIHGFSMGKRG